MEKALVDSLLKALCLKLWQVCIAAWYLVQDWLSTLKEISSEGGGGV